MGWIVVTCLLGWVGDESDSTLRPFIEYRRAMSAAMQREAGATDNASRAAAMASALLDPQSTVTISEARSASFFIAESFGP